MSVLVLPPVSSDYRGSLPPYITSCAICAGPAYALGGGSLWCLSCLTPFVAAGERFQPARR